jgi:acetylcholinesterase
LGYAKQQAIAFNTTGNYYNFSNIRYAAPPLGNLRFAPPEKPATNRTVQNGGNFARQCPQAAPAWELTAAQFIPQYLASTAATTTTNSSTSNVRRASAADAEATAEMMEDCLFLDVFAPKKVFDCEGGDGAPVLGTFFYYCSFYQLNGASAVRML